MKITKWFLPMVLLVFTGCLKLDSNFTIKEDGSGVVDLNYSISEQSVTQAKAMLKIRDQMSALSGEPTLQDPYMEVFLNPTEEQLKKELKKYEAVGVTITKLRVESRDSWRVVQLKLACKNIGQLSKADFFKDNGFSLTKDQSGNYVLFKDRLGAQNPSTSPAIDPETIRMVSPLLQGFNAVFKVTTPGKILKTNAQQKSIYGASWTFNFDRDPNAVAAMQNQQFKVTFESRNLEGKAMSLPLLSQGQKAK